MRFRRSFRCATATGVGALAPYRDGLQLDACVHTYWRCFPCPVMLSPSASSR